MKPIMPLIFVSWLPVLVVVAASVGDAPSPKAPLVEKSPETLIAELSHENFKTRENATREIWKLGSAVTPLLEEAAASNDPEQATRARDLLRKIQLHITPDTDPSLISLVEGYMASKSAEQKLELLGKMGAKRGWLQMLKLYAGEADSDTRAKIEPMMSGVALRAAREQIVKSNPDGAREYLEMAATNASGLLALAEFHRSHGTLDAERERALKSDAPNAQAWLLAIHRSTGDLVEARRAAIAAGELRIADTMAVLSGDPLPWLRNATSERQFNNITSVYGKIAERRWRGEKIRTPDLEPLIQAASGNNLQHKENAMRALFLLGEVESAEASFRNAKPFESFRYFETLERVAEAHEAIGLDPKNPDYKGWVAMQLKDLENEDIEDQREPSSYTDDLAMFANFLERRGLHDEAWDAYSGPLAKIAEDNVDDFLDLLRPLFGAGEPLTGAPFLAKKIAAQWGGDDPIRWDDLIATVFGDEDSTREWWSWLAALDPNASPADRLDAMLALRDIGNDVGNLRHKWLKLVWESIEKSEGDERADSLNRVFKLSDMTGDVRTALKAWDAMEPAFREALVWEQILDFLSADGRWDDVATVILKQISVLTEAKQGVGAFHHAYAATSLRQAGREEEAAVHDAWVEKLTLGTPVLAIQVGNVYAFGKDYKRAAEWWARAARFAESDHPDFPKAMSLHADALLEQGKWLEAAAISELLARAYAVSGYRLDHPLAFMRQRMQADMAHAFALLESDRPRAIAMLEKCHRTFLADGSLADHFFPSLRKLGLIKEHDQWFAETWARVMEILKIYPKSDNTHNTAAWFASRAMRKLDEAEQHAKTALKLNPDQPAYLDTMAEVHFARGNRKKALEWSNLAVTHSPDDVLIRRQHERFRSDPLPK